MDVGLVRTIEALILPPGGLLVLAVLGLVAWRTRVGRFATFLAVLGLYLLSTPQVAAWLMLPLQYESVKTPEQVRAAGAQAPPWRNPVGPPSKWGQAGGSTKRMPGFASPSVGS